MGARLQVVGALGPLPIGTLAAGWTAVGTRIGGDSLAGTAVALPAGWVMARLDERVALRGGVAFLGIALAALAVYLRLVPDPQRHGVAAAAPPRARG